MGVDQLIAKAATRETGPKLPPKAMADLKKVLESNDKQGNRSLRVSSVQFRKYLESTYNIAMGKDMITEVCKRLGRQGWMK